MSEEKIISKQDLEKVSGGSSNYDSSAFYDMWEGYTSTHCANCAQHKYTFTDGESRCDSERQKAAAAFAAGQLVKCDGYIPAC